MFRNGSYTQGEEEPVPDGRDNGGNSVAVKEEATKEGRPRSSRNRTMVEKYDPMLLATYHNTGEKIDVLVKDDEAKEVDIECVYDDFVPEKRRCSRSSRSSSNNSSNRQSNGSKNSQKPEKLLSSVTKCNAVDKKYSKRLSSKISKTESATISTENVQRSFNEVSSTIVAGFVLLDEKSSDGSSASADRRIVQPRKAKQGRTYDEELLQAGFPPGVISQTEAVEGSPSASTGAKKDEEDRNGAVRKQGLADTGVVGSKKDGKKISQGMIRQRNIFKQKYQKSAGKSLHKALSVERARNKGVSASLVDTQKKRLQTEWDVTTSDSVRIRKKVSLFQYPEYPRASRLRERELRTSVDDQNGSIKIEGKNCVDQPSLETTDIQNSDQEPVGTSFDNNENGTSNSEPKTQDQTEASASVSPPNRLRHRMSKILRKTVKYSKEHQERLYAEGNFVIESVNFEMLDVYPIWRILSKDKMLRKYEPVIIDGRLCHMAVDAFKITRFEIGEFETLFLPVVFDVLVDTDEFSVGVAHVMEEAVHLYGYFPDTEHLNDSYDRFLQGIIAQAICGKNPFLNSLPKGLENIDEKLEEVTRQMESCDFWPEKVKDLIVSNPFLRVAVQNQLQSSEVVSCPTCLHQNKEKNTFARCYFQGQNYDRQTFAPVGEPSGKIVQKCCRSCLHKILAFHRLYHYKYWLFLCVKDAVQRTSILVKDNQVLDARHIFKFLMSDFKWTKHMFYDFQSVLAACEEEMQKRHRAEKTSPKRMVTPKKLNFDSAISGSNHKKKLLTKNGKGPFPHSSGTQKLATTPRVYGRKASNPVAALDELQFKKTEKQKPSSGSLDRASERTEQLYKLFDRIIGGISDNC